MIEMVINIISIIHIMDYRQDDKLDLKLMGIGICGILFTIDGFISLISIRLHRPKNKNCKSSIIKLFVIEIEILTCCSLG